nr:BV-like protein [Cotesia vestalis bracovirus]
MQNSQKDPVLQVDGIPAKLFRSVNKHRFYHVFKKIPREEVCGCYVYDIALSEDQNKNSMKDSSGSNSCGVLTSSSCSCPDDYTISYYYVPHRSVLTISRRTDSRFTTKDSPFTQSPVQTALRGLYFVFREETVVNSLKLFNMTIKITFRGSFKLYSIGRALVKSSVKDFVQLKVNYKSFFRLLNAMSKKMNEDMSHKAPSSSEQSTTSSCNPTQSKSSLTRSSTWSNIHSEIDELQPVEMKSYKSNVKRKGLDPTLEKEGTIQKTQSTPFIASKK